MQTDSNLIFVGGTNGNAPLAITSAAVSSFILDLSQGLMINSSTGTFPVPGPESGGQFLLNPSLLWGEDLGPGALRLRLAAWLGSGTPAGGTSLNVAWQGAPDNTTGTAASAVAAMVTYAETGAIPLASLSAGALLPLPDWPDRQIKAAMPRFIRLLFTPVGTFTGLSIAFAGVGTQRPDFNIGQYPGGFQVAP